MARVVDRVLQVWRDGRLRRMKLQVAVQGIRQGLQPAVVQSRTASSWASWDKCSLAAPSLSGLATVPASQIAAGGASDDLTTVTSRLFEAATENLRRPHF